MRRALRIGAWVAGVLVGLPLLVAGLVVVLLNVDPGRRLVERLAGQLTGGQVVIAGLGGRFPDALRLEHAELHDAQGAWLVLDAIVLDWSPTRLLAGEARVDQLQAGRVQVLRLPAAAAPPTPATESDRPFSLPVRVAVERVRIDRAEIGAPVAGLAAVLALDGAAHLVSLQDGDVSATVERLDQPGRYQVSGRIDPARLSARVSLSEPAGGLIASVAHLPAIGAITAEGRVDGPRATEATEVTIAAGALRATAKGTLDLVANAADLDVSARAPAMQPADGVGWEAVALDAHVRGTLARPDATGTLRITALQAAGAGFGSLVAALRGNQGAAGLRATVEGLRIPGPDAGLFAATPLSLTADVRLDEAGRPVAFAIDHALVHARGAATTEGAIGGHADVTLPALARLAAVGGLDVQGQAQLAVVAGVSGGTTRVSVDGTVGVTGGQAPIAGLLGEAARLGVSVALSGGGIAIERAQVDGKALSVSAHGTDNADTLDVAYQVRLPDLAVLAPSVAGAVTVQGTATGKLADFAVAAEVAGEVGGAGVPRGPIAASLRATGLPGLPAGSVTAQGVVEGAKLALAVRAERGADGALRGTIDQADWKSLHVEGAASLAPGASLPQGRVSLRMSRLEDLRSLVGQPIGGSVTAEVSLEGAVATVAVQASHAGVPGSMVARAVLNARIDDPATRPVVAGTLEAEGIEAAGVGGSGKLSVSGPQDALALRLSAALRNLAGADATVAAAATLNATARQVQLASMEAVWKGQAVRLLAPARIGFGAGVAVDRLRVGLQQAVLEVAGKVSPVLDLTASLRGVTPDLARPFVPAVNADGQLSADARLSGTPGSPQGTMRLSATGLHMRAGPARGLPPASITATAQLAGQSAAVDARLAAGSTSLAVTGRAPLGEGALALQANGAVDLAVLDAILAAEGRRVRGRVSLNAAITGSVAAPQVNGAAVLTGGEVQDFAQGVHLTQLAATVQGTGETIRIASLSGRAGAGSVAAGGSLGLRAPMPVDLTVTLRNARPLQSDLLTADLDADLTVRGALQGDLTAGGHVAIRRAEINIPEHMPASIAVLDVRVAGQKPPPPAAPASVVRLDLALDTPGQIFVRGRGLDAVLGGSLQVRGSTATPQVSGGFTLQHGTFSLAGTTLTFVRGKVGFDGAGVTDRIDPSLDFEADSTTSSVTAMLLVGGYASAPKITLSSNPPLPQDEVLAQLLFGRSAKDLGPFQYAAIAAALADLSGATSGASNPLDRVRKGLGLDRLSVGAGANSSSASIEAGRYVANGVYVGAKQGTSGAQTQATVQVDITRGLKVETDVGTGTGANSVGLTYQFEY